jgi:hypothetical protein
LPVLRGYESGGAVSDNIRETTTCERHDEMSGDIKEIKNGVQNIALRLEQGDGRFRVLEEKIGGCERRLDKIDTVFTKVLIAVLIAVILGLGGLIFAGRIDGGTTHHAQQPATQQTGKAP